MSDLLTGSPVLDNPPPPSPTVSAEVSAASSIAGVLAALGAGYSDRPALAWRRDPGSASEWSALTYAELHGLASRAGAFMHDAIGVGPGERVATLGFNSAAYTIADLALTGFVGAVAVPWQTSASIPVLADIAAEAEIAVVATSAEQFTTALRVMEEAHAPAASILVYDTPADSPTADALRSAVSATEINLHLIDLTDTAPLLATEQDTGAAQVPSPPQDLDDLALIVYTSGSTGTPKGAMHSQRSLLRLLSTGFGLTPGSEGDGWVTLNVLPMSHVMGRSTLYQTLGRGGTAFFTARADLSDLSQDWATVQPTQLQFVPRIWEVLHQEFLRALPAATDPDTALQAMQARYLGDRQVTAVTGSAPISAEVRSFVEDFLGGPLIDGYGSTEAGGVLIDGVVLRPPVLDYQLIDVPELGYYTTDSPYPRGELLVATRDIFAGYFRRPELTAEIFDEHGYYRTGDIVTELAPDHLRYIDRRSNVLKLSQGEFVTVAHVEAALTAPPLQQIFVNGNSARPYLLAVAVPTAEAVSRHTDSGGTIDEQGLHTELIGAVRAIAERANLAPFEVPRDLLIETTPFTRENGLLTGIGKLARPQLKAQYGSRLEELYTSLAQDSATRLVAARTDALTRPIGDTVVAVVAALLDVPAAQVSPQSRFADIGGDSLLAVTLGEECQRIFGVPTPVSVITNPTMTLADIADYIADNKETARPTAESVHGPGSLIRASDLTLESFIDADTLRRAADIPSAPTVPNTVLVTGATGFLGRFLLMEWLRRMAERGGRVVCLVRGRDDIQARARLDSIFEAAGTDPLDEYRILAANHLDVVAGDKDTERLGLSPAVWDRLATSVDLIVDPAALVNHLLPYRELFGPNVVGTAELIRLALTTTRKPYVYTSTIAVGDQVPAEQFREAADIREISPTREISAAYANGYGNSKWAGEVLLREAHDHFGLPVTVFRCDMILADGTSTGHLNLPDMFTRLMLTVLATGLAPRSFYALDEQGRRQDNHYDALPVDFLAQAIGALGVTEGFVTYHAMNPHHDAIGLDRFIDWLVDAGEEIEIVDDYGEWFHRFSDATQALPEDVRRASLLPLLANYQVPTPPVDGGLADAAAFRAAVREVSLGVNQAGPADIPHIAPENITSYAKGLRSLNLI